MARIDSLLHRLAGQLHLFDHVQQAKTRSRPLRRTVPIAAPRAAHLPIRIADFGGFVRRFSGRIDQTNNRRCKSPATTSLMACNLFHPRRTARW
jgi:hypothetical protein